MITQDALVHHATHCAEVMKAAFGNGAAITNEPQFGVRGAVKLRGSFNLDDVQDYFVENGWGSVNRGAIADGAKERVTARLDGKIFVIAIAREDRILFLAYHNGRNLS